MSAREPVGWSLFDIGWMAAIFVALVILGTLSILEPIIKK